MGVGLAHLLHDKQTYQHAARLACRRGAPIVLFCLLIALANVPAADISGAHRLCLHVLMTAWIASIVMQPAAVTTSFLDWRPMAFIGAVSYGMYLYHMWCVHIARTLIAKLGLSQLWLQFPLALAGTIAVAAASYYLYEKWFLNLRARFRK